MMGGCTYHPMNAYEYRFEGEVARPTDTLALAGQGREGIWWMDVWYSLEYPYQNLWVNLIFPSGEDTPLSLELIRADGLPYGVRVGPYYRVRLMMPVLGRVDSGAPAYLVPYMRPDAVRGVIGWRVWHQKGG